VRCHSERSEEPPHFAFVLVVVFLFAPPKSLHFDRRTSRPLRVAQRGNPLLYLNPSHRAYSSESSPPACTAMKNGVMKSTMKPTPIIHTCTAIILSSVSKTISDYSETVSRISARKRNPLSPLVHDSQNENRIRCISTQETKINFKCVENFQPPRNVVSSLHENHATHHNVTTKTPH
jgi:hypothetical protein